MPYSPSAHEVSKEFAALRKQREQIAKLQRIEQRAQTTLEKRITRMTPDQLVELCQHPDADLRQLAILAVGKPPQW